MTITSKCNHALWSTLIVASSLCLTHPTLAQESTPTWGSLTVQNKASSSERVSYFQENLRPHEASTYANPGYHKTIVKLNWYDDSVRQSRIVNLKRTFDIYGLFEDTSIKLTEQAKAILDDLGTAITSQGINSRMYAVAGHTIAAGDKKSDQTLSTQRANVVRAYLMENFAIAETRLVPVGFGSHNLKHKKTPGTKENNRIEICMIEDLYEKETTTSVQLPDVNADTPQEIKIVSLDTTKKPKSKVVAEVTSDTLDGKQEYTSQRKSTYKRKPTLRKRFTKRFPKYRRKHMARRYQTRMHKTAMNAGWNTRAAKRRSYRTTRVRYRTRSRRRYTNPYCQPW